MKLERGLAKSVAIVGLVSALKTNLTRLLPKRRKDSEEE